MRGERIGLDWSEKGREPLALVQLVFLHPAECCTEGPLRDLKGNNLARWVVVRVWKFEVDKLLVA